MEIMQPAWSFYLLLIPFLSLSFLFVLSEEHQGLHIIPFIYASRTPFP